MRSSNAYLCPVYLASVLYFLSASTATIRRLASCCGTPMLRVNANPLGGLSRRSHLHDPRIPGHSVLRASPGRTRRRDREPCGVARAWRRSCAASLVASEGLLYMTNDVGVLSCADMKTGERIWQTRLDGVFFASRSRPTARSISSARQGRRSSSRRGGRRPCWRRRLASGWSRHPLSRTVRFFCGATGGCSDREGHGSIRIPLFRRKKATAAHCQRRLRPSG